MIELEAELVLVTFCLQDHRFSSNGFERLQICQTERNRGQNPAVCLHGVYIFLYLIISYFLIN